MSGQSLTRADIPLPGGAEAVFNASGASYCRHSDWLGSSRLSSSATRTLDAATAYAPYGEEETGAAAGYRDFTGKTQDIAHGQPGTDPNGSYDFPAREYSPTQSRWRSPDPAASASPPPATASSPASARGRSGVAPARPGRDRKDRAAKFRRAARCRGATLRKARGASDARTQGGRPRSVQGRT